MNRLADNTTMNRAAQALGRLARGKPKTISDQERARRSAAFTAIRNASRWPVLTCDVCGFEATAGKMRLHHKAEHEPEDCVK